MTAPTLVWFRSDLRLGDNPALQAAFLRGGPLVPVFIWAPDEDSPWPPGAASRWWLHQSLAALDHSLRQSASRLILRHGPTLESLRSLIKESGAATVVWNRRYEPAAIARDAAVQLALQSQGVDIQTFPAALLHEPAAIRNQAGRPFQVFTPFWRHCLRQPAPGICLPAPQSLTAPKRWPRSLRLDELELEPRISWAQGFRAAWQPGEAGAHANLRSFLHRAAPAYDQDRNRPDRVGTSRLSPHLHFGELSPRQVWHAFKAGQGTPSGVRPSPAAATSEDPGRATSRAAAPVSVSGALSSAVTLAPRSDQFLTELGWREFAAHLLVHFPATPGQPLRPEFTRFPWRKNDEWLAAWQRGRTGYPLVDAGMRQLWATGWMHNRVRMVAASFLVKHLLINWTDGARWFWDTLVDADLASNTLGWQWTAGCGADAAPYFRVFNPVSQGEKFDPEGAYVRRWVPELERLPQRWIHQPWAAPKEALAEANIELGSTYPQPLVHHFIARQVALDAYARMRK